MRIKGQGPATAECPRPGCSGLLLEQEKSITEIRGDMRCIECGFTVPAVQG